MIITKSVQCGMEVTIDTQETVGRDFGTVDQSVCAILIKRDGTPGAVRIFGDVVTNVVTGPTQGDGYVVVLRKTGQSCRLFGSPSMRFFRRRNP